jgi:primosomal protein N' (replication factor Y)
VVSPFFDKEAETHRYSGWLPHWRQADKLYFVTFRLDDSVSQQELKAWMDEKRSWESHHPKPWSEKVWVEYYERFTERMERLLDAGYGSCALARPEIGELVEAALRHFDGSRYQLGDFVVMPNHVHVLLRPAAGQGLEAILHSWKSYTSHEANRLLKTSGTFWRDEYFDHLVRSEQQCWKFRRYIKNNPAEARLPSTKYRLGCGTFESAAGVPPAVAYESTVVNLGAPGAPNCRRDAGSTFLLHGVTGSGKTEVYLQAIAHALEQGKSAIVLVPEISLTPQTVERFKARFSSGRLQTLVAVLHSHLSSGERHDEWHKIRQGRARIVIGARSAIFAPVHPLGLVIVDEEHEHSYKQEEAPRYHARDVAVVRGQMEGAVVVLGSATPSLESFYNVKRGKYTLLELLARADDKRMPVVRIVDMRKENRKQKGTPIFSEQLKEAMTQRLERKEQTILFLNRRGYSTSLQCTQCGYVAECPNCSVSLTFHRQAQKLACHICGFDSAVPKVCPEPKCGNPAIRYSGLGTEKVETTLVKLFPHARIKRMDSDTLKRKEDYRRILGDFRLGKIDILVGTQMIAKGLHFPNVTLVGIIYADLSLHLPDFRAGERTFQLLTQVAGRAGRGEVEGEVIVQAFTPFHPAIQYARRHDFTGFYEQEIEFREQLKYPPVSRIALLTLRGRNEEKVRFSAEHVRRELEKLITGKENSSAEDGKTGKRENESDELDLGEKGPSSRPPVFPSSPSFRDLLIAGPAPAPLARAESHYRYQIMLRTRQMTRLSQRLAKMTETLALPDDIALAIDIDPVNLA